MNVSSQPSQKKKHPHMDVWLCCRHLVPNDGIQSSKQMCVWCMHHMGVWYVLQTGCCTQHITDVQHILPSNCGAAFLCEKNSSAKL